MTHRFTALCLIALSVVLSGQQVDPSLFLKPTPDSWPTYHGDYSGQHHSRLAQITPDNVKQITLSWAFNTGQTQQIKATPVLVNGVIYITTPDNLWAIDARAGRQLWRYTYPANEGFHIGHRGVAVRGDLVYLTTPDSYLIALDTRTGQVQWKVEIANGKRGYWSTNAPLIIRNHLLVGVSGDFDNLPGILKSFDPETGGLQWTFYSTPPAGTADSISGGATGGHVDDRHVRSGVEPCLRRHRQSDAGPQRSGPARRQQMDRQHRRPRSRHGTDEVGISGDAARHARLGCIRGSRAGGCAIRRHRAQAAVAGVPQRLFLRSRSRDREEPVDHAVCQRELGEGC